MAKQPYLMSFVISEPPKGLAGLLFLSFSPMTNAFLEKSSIDSYATSKNVSLGMEMVKCLL